jgi:hypothetical protein
VLATEPKKERFLSESIRSNYLEILSEALSNRFIKDIHTLLRILFSINNKWEPDWKWLNRHIHLLDIKPDNMQKRIDQIMNLYGNPPQSVEFCLDLILDTLYLISDQYDVTEQINVVLKSKRNVI